MSDVNGLPIILTANGLLQRSADTTFPYQQDSSFWYLTGIDEPDITLVIDGDGEYLIVPGRSASREAFDGAVDREVLTQVSGIKTVIDEQAGWERLTKLVKGRQSVALLDAAPPYIEAYGMYTNPARRRLKRRLLSLRPELEVVDLRPTLAHMRMVKQPPELAAIREAIAVTIAGLREVTGPERLGAYQYEYEIEADLSRAFRRTGAEGHAFAPIVASGKRGCTLHNVANNGRIGEGELIVLDVGAGYRHYAADITRTVAASKPTARQQQIYDAVLDVQRFALEMLKPGTLLKDYEQKVQDYMGQKLLELGLLGKGQDTEAAAVRKYYPHATSHFLGLDVHDVGDYTQPLAPGMVLTCEPGIYIDEESIGVRIEDDILITESGHEVLTDALPRQLHVGVVANR